MFLRIKISTKNKNSLNFLLTAISKLKKSNRLIKCSSKQNRKKFVTVLKSPHVNKSSQEQFEFRTFSKTLLLQSSQPVKDLLVLKMLKNTSFSGVKWEISVVCCKDNHLKHASNKLSPNNVKLKMKISSQNFKQAQRYVQLFDNHGELALRKVLTRTCIFSSVGQSNSLLS